MNDDDLLMMTLDVAEDRLQEAMRGGDVAALSHLLDDAVIYTGPDGRQISKEQDLNSYASGAVDIAAFVEHRRDSRVVGSTGLTWVLAEVEGRAGEQRFAARLQYTRTWLHDVEWRVIAAHASFVPASR